MAGPVRSRVFASLSERNVRIFFAGLGVSNIGTWAQTTAVVLLVTRLGGEGLEIGLAVAAQFLPVLILGLPAGSLADRRDRHRITLLTQMGMAIQAFALGFIDLSGLATIPLVCGLTAIYGTLSALDTPARRAFSTELVPPERLANVLSLSTSVMTGARIFGPSIAAFVAAEYGTAWVFLGNGASFLAMIVGLLRIDRDRLHRVPTAPRSPKPIREGLAAVWSDPALRMLLVVLTLVATFSFNHLVYLPLVVRDQLMASEQTFGWVLSCMGIGNVLGALLVARLVVVPLAWFYVPTIALGAFMSVIAFSARTEVVLLLAIPMGIAMTALISSSGVILQQRSDASLRARLMALTSVILMGSTPIGGPVTGWIADEAGVFDATVYGGVIAVAAGLIGLLRSSRREPTG
ncbi:unnamed protein product [Discosporangium mesarthrocarpum]